MNALRPWKFYAKGDGALQIDIMEDIGSDAWTGQGITSKQFAEDLRAAGDVESIALFINSPGGSCFEGISIFPQLVAHPARVTATVTGIAASIASVILMGADTIYIAKNAFVMCHNAFTVCAGDAEDKRKMASVLDKVQGSILSAYKGHSPLNLAKLEAMCAEETWMDSKEAVANGFADHILNDDADVAASVDLSKFAAKFKHLPQPIAARFAGAKPEVDQGVPAEEKLRLTHRLALLKRLGDA